jgi:branched-chain amino acid transport system permease protein
VVRPKQASPLSQHAAAEAERGKLGATVLSVEKISKSFGGVQAVQDVAFSVRANEILGIIGPNGAGKTTLFNLLNGVVTPSAGLVRLGDKNIAGMAPNRVARAGIARTFQVVRAFPRMTVLENVVVGAYARHKRDADAWQAASAAVAQVGLSAWAAVSAGALTSRELRLMELARALAGSPSLLLLDEPLAGLGAGDTAELIDVVRQLPARGVTVVIIEHTMHAMLDLVDRFVVLDQGRLLTEGPPAEVMRRPAVIEAYLGRKWAVADAAA